MADKPDRGIAVAPKDKGEIIALVQALMPDARVYLFGSRATESFSRASDIDIALDTGQEIDVAVLGEVREVLNATDIPQKIDVVDLHMIPDAMRDAIVSKGILWK